MGIGEAYWGEIDATVELVQRTRVRFLGGATRAELRCSQTGSHGPAEEVDLSEAPRSLTDIACRWCPTSDAKKTLQGTIDYLLTKAITDVTIHRFLLDLSNKPMLWFPAFPVCYPEKSHELMRRTL